MSHTDHLHVETKLLPVKYHSELLAKQYWLSCYQSHHPCHHLTTLPAPVRNMKGMLMKYNSEVLPLADEGITDVDTYRDCLCTLHSQAVVEAKTNFVPNRVLQASPPDIGWHDRSWTILISSISLLWTVTSNNLTSPRRYIQWNLWYKILEL